MALQPEGSHHATGRCLCHWQPRQNMTFKTLLLTQLCQAQCSRYQISPFSFVHLGQQTCGLQAVRRTFCLTNEHWFQFSFPFQFWHCDCQFWKHTERAETQGSKTSGIEHFFPTFSIVTIVIQSTILKPLCKAQVPCTIQSTSPTPHSVAGNQNRLETYINCRRQQERRTKKLGNLFRFVPRLGITSIVEECCGWERILKGAQPLFSAWVWGSSSGWERGGEIDAVQGY